MTSNNHENSPGEEEAVVLEESIFIRNAVPRDSEAGRHDSEKVELLFLEEKFDLTIREQGNLFQKIRR